MRILALATVAGVLATLTGAAHAVVVTLTPDVISGVDTNTASFSNADLTLTPFNGSTPTTFNGNATRLGIDDLGTSNVIAFNDPDTDPANDNEERLQFEFVSGAGLTQIAWDFARADGPGPNDGVFISGFAEDPLASFGGAFATAPPDPVYDDLTGTLSFQILGTNFGANVHSIDLANPSASSGQTLLLTVTDTTSAGAQLPILSISYEDDVQVPDGIDGDYNADGVVDATDYAVWREALGTGAVLPNDPTPGTVDASDLTVWRDNFGATAAGASTAVPEPASVLLWLIGAVAVSRKRA